MRGKNIRTGKEYVVLAPYSNATHITVIEREVRGGEYWLSVPV